MKILNYGLFYFFFSVVMLDEVYERIFNIDLIMGFFRKVKKN